MPSKAAVTKPVARVPQTIRLKLRALAAKHSRRLGFRIGLDFGETDDGHQWASVGSRVEEGPVVSVLAGAGPDGSYVLTDRWGRRITASGGLYRAADVVLETEKALERALGVTAARTEAEIATFTPGDLELLETLRRDLCVRTRRRVVTILQPATGSGGLGASRAILALEKFGVGREGGKPLPVPLATIEAAPDSTDLLIDAARLAAMREFRLLCSGEPAGITTPKLTAADLPPPHRPSSGESAGCLKPGQFTDSEVVQLQSLAEEVGRRIWPAVAAIRQEPTGASATLSARTSAREPADLVILRLRESRRGRLVAVHALAGPDSMRSAYRAGFPDAVRAAARIAVRAWRAVSLPPGDAPH